MDFPQAWEQKHFQEAAKALPGVYRNKSEYMEWFRFRRDAPHYEVLGGPWKGKDLWTGLQEAMLQVGNFTHEATQRNMRNVGHAADLLLKVATDCSLFRLFLTSSPSTRGLFGGSSSSDVLHQADLSTCADTQSPQHLFYPLCPPLSLIVLPTTYNRFFKYKTSNRSVISSLASSVFQLIRVVDLFLLFAVSVSSSTTEAQSVFVGAAPGGPCRSLASCPRVRSGSSMPSSASSLSGHRSGWTTRSCLMGSP